MAQISAIVSNGAMEQPTQCSPCLSKTRAARGSLAKSAATVSSAQLMSGARLIRVHPIPCSIVDHRRYEVFVMAQRGRNRGALRGWQVFGDGDERVRSQQNDVLAPAAEDAALLPGAHEPTDRIQRGPRHLGD